MGTPFALSILLAVNTAVPASDAPADTSPPAKVATHKPMLAGTGRAAPTMSFAGQTLGQPVPTRECPWGASGNGRRYLGPYDTNYVEVSPCFKHEAAAAIGEPVGPGESFVRIRPHEPLAGMSSDRPPRARVVSGKLEALTIFTDGAYGQDGWMAMLTDLFGQPSRMHTVQWNDKTEGSLPVIEAGWEFSDLDVEYIGATVRLDTGVIVIETPAARVARLKEESSLPKAP